jgi:hypothetical protein
MKQPRPMEPSLFNTLIVIRFYNDHTSQYHHWVTDDAATAREHIQTLEEHPHITDITAQDASCK